MGGVILVKLSVRDLVMDWLARVVHVGKVWHEHGTHHSPSPLQDGTMLVEEQSDSGSRVKGGRVLDICSAQTQNCDTVRLHWKYPMGEVSAERS